MKCHLYIALCGHQSRSNHLLSPHIGHPLPLTPLTPFPLATSILVSVSVRFVSLFICRFQFYNPHMSDIIWFLIFFFLTDLFGLEWYSQGPSTLFQNAVSHLSYGSVVVTVYMCHVFISSHLSI